jgi:hypothetical protein
MSPRFDHNSVRWMTAVALLRDCGRTWSNPSR